MTGSFCKIVVIGDPAVGKSTLITRYIEREFKYIYKPTLGLAINSVKIQLDEINNPFDLLIFELAAQESFRKVRKTYYQDAVGALIMYDITRPETLDSVTQQWIVEFKENIEDGIHLLVGNKIDLVDRRSISLKDGKKVANKISASDFFETSAKSGVNIDNCFEKLISLLVKNEP